MNIISLSAEDHATISDYIATCRRNAQQENATDTADRLAELLEYKVETLDEIISDATSRFDLERSCDFCYARLDISTDDTWTNVRDGHKELCSSCTSDLVTAVLNGSLENSPVPAEQMSMPGISRTPAVKPDPDRVRSKWADIFDWPDSIPEPDC